MIAIRQAKEDDKDRLLGFMASAAGTEKARVLKRRWHWQWHCDPRLDEPGYRGVVAEWQGNIIGSVSCMPAGLYIAGESAPAVWLTDVRIDWGLVRQAMKDLRRRGERKSPEFSGGIAAAMFNHPSAGRIQLGKHIAEEMMTIGERAGFTEMPGAANFMRRTSFKWPLRKSLGEIAGGFAGAIADLAIPRVPRPLLTIQKFDAEFDDRFDRLFDRARNEYAAVTLRDSTVLNWHYREHPDTSYDAFVIERGNEVRGYLVLKAYERKGRLIARIVDLLTERGDAEAIESLVAAALRHSRSRGAERADWFASGADLSGCLSRLGFSARLTKRKRAQVLMQRHLPEVVLYVTSGDGDGG